MLVQTSVHCTFQLLYNNYLQYKYNTISKDKDKIFNKKNNDEKQTIKEATYKYSKMTTNFNRKVWLEKKQ